VGSVTTTNWAARLSVGLIGTALILGFAPATSAHDVTTSVYSEAYRIQRPVPERVVLSVRPVTIDLPPPVTTMPHIASSAGATTTSTTTTLPRIHTGYSNSMTGQQYRYFERSQEVMDLQIELGMRSVDGVYGPQTRKAHVLSLGGPHALLYQNYPEFGQMETPCSHGCMPGDGHYELPNLGELINEYFMPQDRALARMIAFCESSGQTHHIGSDVVSDALAVGWFQHLAKYWAERSEKAGWGDYHPFHGRANVAVAAWLFYSSGVHHWNPSKGCWGEL